MNSTTVRVSDETRSTLRELARRTGEPMQTILDRAVAEYRRRCFFAELQDAFSALRNDPDAWAAERAERAEWDATLGDGLGAE